jgi:hypothetical protein
MGKIKEPQTIIYNGFSGVDLVTDPYKREVQAISVTVVDDRGYVEGEIIFNKIDKRVLGGMFDVVITGYDAATKKTMRRVVDGITVDQDLVDSFRPNTQIPYSAHHVTDWREVQ